jgi:hypothetical protein
MKRMLPAAFCTAVLGLAMLVARPVSAHEWGRNQWNGYYGNERYDGANRYDRWDRDCERQPARGSFGRSSDRSGSEYFYGGTTRPYRYYDGYGRPDYYGGYRRPYGYRSDAYGWWNR